MVIERLIFFYVKRRKATIKILLYIFFSNEKQKNKGIFIFTKYTLS